MAPPAKRQRRLIVLSSDHEDPAAILTHKPIPTRRQAKLTESNTAISSIAPQTRPNNLSEGHAAKPKSGGKVQTSRPISSFFSAGIQEQQSNGQKAPKAVTPGVEDNEDIIVDDSPVENENDPGRTTKKILLDHRKKHLASAHDNAASTNRPSLQGGIQRFKIPEHASSIGNGPGISCAVKAKTSAIDMRPWAEKHGPNNLEELMVHKRKVSDVRNWLENVLRGHDCKVGVSRVTAVV